MSGGVLWVTEEVPDRNGGGGNVRQAHLLIELARRMPVDLLVGGPVVDPAVRAAARSIEVIDVGPAPLAANPVVRRLSVLGTEWLQREPLDVAWWGALRKELAVAIERRTRAADADVSTVLLHHQVLAPLAMEPRFGAARWVLHLFHAAAVRSEQLAAVADRRMRRALLRQDGRNARRLEEQAIGRVDALVVATAEDAARLSRPATPTYVVGQGVDLTRAATPLPSAATVTFTGSLDYEPNVDGVLWFVQHAWPIVRRARADARFVIAGRNPDPAVAALDGHDGIVVQANVPVMAPVLDAARVLVIPLRVGTGVRVKALDAFAAGRPVVGTSVGLEGIGIGPDDAIVADTPDAIARSVLALLDDDERATALGEAGRRFAEAHASWPRMTDALVEALT